MRFRVRASQAKNLMSKGKGKADWGETAKKVIRDQAIFDLYGHRSEIDAKMINKGLALEDDAIRAVSLSELALNMVKNTERLENDWVTGECDILTPNAIYDTKCSWSIDSFPLTQDEADKKVKASGYDWQGQVYMWLWERKIHHVCYVLLPTPYDLLGRNDDEFMHIELVNKMPLSKRIKKVSVEFNQDKIYELRQRVEDAQPLYLDFVEQLKAEVA